MNPQSIHVAEESPALPAGHLLHEYRIDAVLGQGGFGMTYLATDVHLRARVAIKEYLPLEFARRAQVHGVSARTPEDTARYRAGLQGFLAEARTLASFRHPNIVKVARFFEAHGTAYLVLEYEEGRSLKDWFTANPRVTESRVAALLQPLLDGLSLVHAAGVLHLDIKPDNIQVRDTDGSLVLLDFGAARQGFSAASPHEGARTSLTPGYAPAEQYTGVGLGPWTDVHALAATLYWLVAGRAPPPADQRMTGDACMPASQLAQGRFSAEFLQAIDWGLDPDPARRPRSLDEWRTLLFASHASRLGLQEALRRSDAVQAVTRFTARLRPSSWPLQFKMMASLCLAVLLPLVIVGSGLISRSADAIAAGELRSLEALAQSTAGRVAQLVGDCENLARMVGIDDDFAEVLKQPTQLNRLRMQAKLETMAQANPAIDVFMLIDLSGVVLASNDEDIAGHNVGFRDYFQEASRGREHMTGIVLGAVTGAAVVVYAQPVFDASRGLIGVLAMRVKATAFQKAMNESMSASGRVPFLIDDDGVVVFHPDERLLYRSLGTVSADALQAIRRDQRFRRDRIDSLAMPELAHAMVRAKTHGHIAYRSAVTGEEEIAGFAPVAGQNWVVGVSEVRSRFDRPLRELVVQLSAATAAVGFIFLLVATLFARRIVRPVRALTRAVDSLKAGDFEAAFVAVESADEIGRLARAFNVMVDVLRERENRRRNG